MSSKTFTVVLKNITKAIMPRWPVRGTHRLNLCLRHLISQQLQKDQNKALLANVTIGELHKAISRLKPNKS